LPTPRPCGLPILLRYDNPRILDEDGLRAAHVALQDAEIVNDDFTALAGGLGPGDFVYFDPPYVPVSKTANYGAIGRPAIDSCRRSRSQNKI
jgi:DNA adenine methylase